MPVGPDGRIHTIYTHNPNTLRLASQEPNMQNLPRPGAEEDLASIIRGLIIAGPGNVLLARDYSGIEAVLTGYFACDPQYIRLAKQDVHTYYTVHALYALEGKIKSYDLPDINWPDDKLFPYLAELKKTYKEPRNRLYKHLVHACVTGDHEVLTLTGWKPLVTLQEGEQIAQWDRGKITFVVPSAIIRQPYNGPMISLFGKGMSATMTPEHRLPVYNSFKVLFSRYVNELPKSGHIPICGELEGQETTNEKWLKLAVAIQADGHFPNYGTKMKFHFVKLRKRLRLRQLLEELHVPYDVIPCGDHPDGERFSLSYQDIQPIFYWLDDDKNFNQDNLLASSLAGRKVFLAELPHWDGSRSYGLPNKQTNYLTTNGWNAKVVQTIAHISGEQGLLRINEDKRDGRDNLYKVSFNARKYSSLEMLKKSAVEFSGIVYCVTVPSGWFLIKHQDRISVTGNSNFMQSPQGAQAKIFSETRIDYPIKTVAKVMDVYFELFPSIPRWHRSVLQEAERDGFLRNPFDYIVKFSKVYNWKKEYGKWVSKPNPDVANKAVAMKPQSTAAAIIKESILRLYFDRFEEAGQYLRLQVHDENLTECPANKVLEVDAVLKEEMERPIPQLRLPASYGMGEYLVINTEAKAGPSWAKMKGL